MYDPTRCRSRRTDDGQVCDIYRFLQLYPRHNSSGPHNRVVEIRELCAAPQAPGPASPSGLRDVFPPHASGDAALEGG